MGCDNGFCPVVETLDLLNQRWNLRIVRSLLSGPRHFNELRREHGINPRTLCSRLRQLEGAGLITRRVISENPPSVEYVLTEKGQELNEAFGTLADWARKWAEQPA